MISEFYLSICLLIYFHFIYVDGGDNNDYDDDDDDDDDEDNGDDLQNSQYPIQRSVVCLRIVLLLPQGIVFYPQTQCNNKNSNDNNNNNNNNNDR